MNNKLIFTSAIIGIFIGIFTVSMTVVNAKSINMVVTLKNEANIDKSKNEISKIPKIKIIKIKNRDVEWSKLVNKMDLPNIQNPYKNEITIKINKRANIKEISDKIKALDFVENIK